MDRSPREGRCGRSGFGLVCMIWVLVDLLAPQLPTVSRAADAGSGMPMPENAEAGRRIFNGKGVCYYCHGIDGDRARIPQLDTDLTALIARLNPPPADLRNAKQLRLTNDKARAKAIREGHPGTGMFPDTTMTDQELADTLAYLAVLRSEASPKRK